jgi:hypothetical protein
MIKQIVNGKNLKTISANMSTGDFTVLSSILAGKLEVWDLVSEGGTAANVAKPNYIRLAVGKKGISNRVSCAVYLPHVKTTKTAIDLETAIVGLFDADYETAVKCEYCTVIGASSKGVR